MPRHRQATLTAVAVCALAVLLSASTHGSDPQLAEAQPRPAKVFRVGVLSFESAPAAPAATGDALVQELKDLGYVEGQNLSVEYRWADGRPDRLRGLAADLVRSSADVI